MYILESGPEAKKKHIYECLPQEDSCASFLVPAVWKKNKIIQIFYSFFQTIQFFWASVCFQFCIPGNIHFNDNSEFDKNYQQEFC